MMPTPLEEEIPTKRNALQTDKEKELISEKDHNRFLHLARKNAKDIDGLLDPMVQAKYSRYFGLPNDFL